MSTNKELLAIYPPNLYDSNHFFIPYIFDYSFSLQWLLISEGNFYSVWQIYAF